VNANPEGAGIGLTVCRKIISDHGSWIWVDQSYEGGARIVMTPPAAHDSAQPQPSLNAA
jgi:K+-sensing histidine kinase KdpD